MLLRGFHCTEREARHARARSLVCPRPRKSADTLLGAHQHGLVLLAGQRSPYLRRSGQRRACCRKGGYSPVSGRVLCIVSSLHPARRRGQRGEHKLGCVSRSSSCRPPCLCRAIAAVCTLYYSTRITYFKHNIIFMYNRRRSDAPPPPLRAASSTCL